MQLKPIVAATDLSDSATPAAQWAHDVAAAGSTRVIAAHVFEIGFDSWWKSKYEVLMDDAKHRQATDAIRAWYRDAVGVDAAGVELRVDECSHGLSEVVEAHDAELLVMAPSGKGNFMQAVVGSRVHHIVARPPCPVAVVRSTFDADAPIAATTDFSPSSEVAIRFAAKLAAAVGAELRIVTVAHRPNTPALPNLFDELVEDLSHAMRERLDGFVDSVLGEGHGATLAVLEGEEVHKTLEGYADSAGLGVMVMGRTGHRSVVGDLIGSVPRALINHAPCTVVVTPGQAG